MEDLNFVENYRPKKKETNLRILLHGPVGAGKSSFINSVSSCLRGKINSNKAFTDATFGNSFTTIVSIYSRLYYLQAMLLVYSIHYEHI